MFLILMVCLMKLLDKKRSQCENGGRNGNQIQISTRIPISIRRSYNHTTRCCSSQDTNRVRGMTEDQTNDIDIPQPIRSRPLASQNQFQKVNNGTSDHIIWNTFTYKINEPSVRLNIKENQLDIRDTYLEQIIYDKISNLNNNLNLINEMATPEADLNSNPHIGGQLGCSVASSQDFAHDNSDYQWFLDYGYREGGIAPQSILSSLSTSFNGLAEMSYYEDIAKNMDANLAEVDMESFHAEDIHSFINRLSSVREERNRKKIDLPLDGSIMKSGLLFSPMKETHISIDSLDMENFPDNGDIIMTCKANKNNYTIAFEGSTMYSDDSYYGGGGENMKQDRLNNLQKNIKEKSIDLPMCRSDTGFTTWSKLKKSTSARIQRYPSGNNNTSMSSMTVAQHTPYCLVRKSSSLPNFVQAQRNLQAISNSTMDTSGKNRPVAMSTTPISGNSESASPAPLQNSGSSSGQQDIQNSQPFNLVKLFIKQKSSSVDTCMDVSSGCWPSDSSSSAEANRLHKRSLNDSGKGSALSRHVEDVETDFQYDSLDVPQPIKPVTKSTLRPNNFLLQQSKNIHVSNNNNSSSSEKDSESCNLITAKSNFSDASHTTNSDNVTQMLKRTKVPLHMLTKSIQTSVLATEQKTSQMQSSFLAQLKKLGEGQKAPVYVIYPNYALPDLTFVKTHQSDIILSPMGFKESFNAKKRPTSMCDIDSLKAKKYSDMIDWKSLAFLLPNEYRKLLKHIPETDLSSDPYASQKPLFCMTPPIRRSRMVKCDCVNYIRPNCNNQQTCTSSSDSSQQPSSGYRGSSTMINEMDSESQFCNYTDQNTMYVYNYETSAERPPSGRRGYRTSDSKSKRYSMVDEASNTRRQKVEKRRSLQELHEYPEMGNLVNQEIVEECNDSTEALLRYYANRINAKLSETNLNYKMELNEECNRQMHLRNLSNMKRTESDNEGRIRADTLLPNMPRTEMKYYTEITSILESMEEPMEDHYDRTKLRNEVSRALSQTRASNTRGQQNNKNFLNVNAGKKFSTPPNSPNISMAKGRTAGKSPTKEQTTKEKLAAEREKLEKIQRNRFKRLQIQWELLSKDSANLMKDFGVKETKSGGSTPVGPCQRSRIPRPISFPSATKTQPETTTKLLRSPSRIVPPKKYNSPQNPVPTTPVRTVNRVSSASRPNTTPKRTVTKLKPMRFK